MKTNNAIVYWSNNIIFDCSQTRYFFHRTKLVRLQKANYAVVFSLVSTIHATKLKLKLTATTVTKVASPQINCNMKETSFKPIRKRMHDVAKKRHFITKVSCKNFSVLV